MFGGLERTGIHYTSTQATTSGCWPGGFRRSCAHLYSISAAENLLRWTVSSIKHWIPETAHALFFFLLILLLLFAVVVAIISHGTIVVFFSAIRIIIIIIIIITVIIMVVCWGIQYNAAFCVRDSGWFHAGNYSVRGSHVARLSPPLGVCSYSLGRAEKRLTSSKNNALLVCLGMHLELSRVWEKRAGCPACCFFWFVAKVRFLLRIVIVSQVTFPEGQ